MGTVSSNCTVVMATFNGAKYVAEQFASLRDQTMPPCRVIVSDDGSSNTTRKLASFDKKADFDVIVLDGLQRGYAENFWSAQSLSIRNTRLGLIRTTFGIPQDFAMCTSFGGNGCILPRMS